MPDLAAKLTGWKIDIKSETDAREIGIYPREETIKLFDDQDLILISILMKKSWTKK